MLPKSTKSPFWSTWCRSAVEMGRVPRRRVEAIDESLDWYYVDDYAREYLEHAGRYDLARDEIGRRILVTPANSDAHGRGPVSDSCPRSSSTVARFRSLSCSHSRS